MRKYLEIRNQCMITSRKYTIDRGDQHDRSFLKVHMLLLLTQSIILSKLLSDIRFGVLEGALVLLQLLYEVLHLSRVLDVGGPILGAVLTNKP